MDIMLEPGTLAGTVAAQPSKSAAHRAAICAALAKGTSVLSPVVPTRDMQATLRAVSALGATWQLEGERLSICGIQKPPAVAEIDCEESGSTLRFFIPIAAALGVTCRFDGTGKLPSRPNNILTDLLAEHGAASTKKEDEILTISGQLQSGEYHIAGNVSSQYITGLLFALPLLAQDSTLLLTTPLESAGYVEMTLAALAQFGITIHKLPQGGFHIPGGQSYQPQNATIEGDYSGAAFWLCAGAIAGDITVTGLDPASPQGDRAIVPLLEQMGATVTTSGNSVRVQAQPLQALEIDLGEIPDLGPILAVTAAFAKGTTRLNNAGRLRIKECDRIEAICAGINALGGNAQDDGDSLVIIGGSPLFGGSVDSFADHRIAMALSIAAQSCQKSVWLLGAHCVEKSYPDFYSDLMRLGGICHGV